MKCNASVTFCTFLSLPFFPCRPSQDKTTELILTHDGSYDAILRKKIFLGATKFKFNILTYFYKNMKNYNGAYGEN